MAYAMRLAQLAAVVTACSSIGALQVASSSSSSAVLAENPACKLAASTLPRFKYLRTYGWHKKQAPWTNVAQSQSLEQIEAFYNETKAPGM
jgi:hypothetical protein